MAPDRRRRRTVQDDDVASSSGASLTSTPASKRRRLTSELLSEESENEVLPDSFRRSPRTNRVNGIPVERHQPGSIIRITVKNFVTYTSATFNCGPSLNMIIGPNGTGKSTLVCAICLGLGSKPTVLGRAKEIGEFVKHGFREAEIEVELAGLDGHENRVIHHTIKREGNKSSWRLDGRNATHKEIMRVVQQEFSIQIDNLCQFLPQDRVVEFAQMTPVGLLESTQKAAASEQMTAWHSELKSLGSERLSKQDKFKNSSQELDALEKRQVADQVDVNKQKERESLKTRLAAFDIIRPGLQYRTEKRKLDQGKLAKKHAEDELQSLQRQVRPVLERVEAKKKRIAQLNVCVQEARNLCDRWDATTEGKATAYGQKTEEIDGCDEEHKKELQGNQQRKAEINRLQVSIRKLQSQKDEEPVSFDARGFNEQLREKDKELRDISREAEEIKNAEGDRKRHLQEKAAENHRLDKEIQEMNSKTGQQIQKLREVSEDSARAWNWLRSNQHEFKERIYGPPILECSVKDPRYAAALESLLNKSEFTAFTATNFDDWVKFKDICSQQLSLMGVTSRNITRSLEQYQPPISQDDLVQYGLENWAIEFLEGPEPVLAMLCDSRGLNRTAVTLEEQTTEQFEVLKNSPISNWVAGRQAYTITRRREYGPNATTIRVNVLKPAQIWTGANVDTDKTRELRAKLLDIQRDIAEIEEEQNVVKGQLAEIRKRREAINAEKSEIQEDKNRRQKAYSEWQALPTKIATLQEKLDTLVLQNSQVHDRLGEIARRQQALYFERAQLAIDYPIHLSKGLEMLGETIELEIQFYEAESEVEQEQKKSEYVRAKLAEMQSEVIRLEADIRAQRDRAKSFYTQFTTSRARIAELDSAEEIEGVMEEWLREASSSDSGQAIPEKTIEELEAEAASTTQRIELIHGDNPGLMRRFEERAAAIERIKSQIAAHGSELNDLNTKITDIRQRWEPQLEKLVDKISTAFAHNFERIGCNGEVGIRTNDEDFREWAIEIKVKFRENEDLAILDSHRQSGGERAVSTIFYLMALQSMARSPFRVVDEINQGMDPRNERMVHERMVDIACSENTSQYFLITPKLLNDLKYHERMVVHIIYSGEEMPRTEEDGVVAKLDFKYLADLALNFAEKA